MSPRLLIVALLVLSVALATGPLGGCPPTPPPPGEGGDNGDPGDGNGDNGGQDRPDDGDAAKTRHERIFTDIFPAGFTDTSQCMACHEDIAQDVVASAHWLWEGPVTNIVGFEGETHGKMDLINNFCIAVPSNEGRCAQCHPSYGWKSNAFDFGDTSQVDCLVCHDTTGTYKKHPTANGGGGPPALMVDGELTAVEPEDLSEVVYSAGTPSRGNCGFCHFNAGGGDNVKQGSLSSTLTNPTFAMDVHMGSVETGGKDFACQTCHTEMNHTFSGMVFHSVDEGGAAPDCVRCHGDSPHRTSGSSFAFVLNNHTARIACETCHIPAFSRQMPTKVAWYWDEAGDLEREITTDEFGKPTYDPKKGRFVWDKNVTPAYLWYNDKWERKILRVNDTYDEAGTEADPVVLAAPVATIDDADAKIHPFKKMIGRQPADIVNRRLVVPHLFGQAAGENPYWSVYDWAKALDEGAAYTDVPFEPGDEGFVNTVMYLRVSHEVAPASEALLCNDCHGNTAFFRALGYERDPGIAN